MEIPILKPPKSPKDYFHIGPVYLAKRLCAALTFAGLTGTIAFCGLPWDLMEGFTLAPPAYRWNNAVLSEYAGRVRILDNAGTIRYEGEILQGVCTGQGKVFDESGQLVYQGPLVDGRYEGQKGRYYQDSVLIYEGSFVKGLYEGEGILTTPETGEQYIGAFVSGKPEGEGYVRSATGTLVREGTFLAGRLHGEGKEYWKSGILAREGTFANGLLEGTGRAYTQAGTLLYEGGFHAGLYDGNGTLYDRETGVLIYQGMFSRGHSDGEGTLYDLLGQAYYKGPVLDEKPRGAAFIGLSLKEVEQAFATHALIYTCTEKTAFAFPAQRFIFVTDVPVPLVQKQADNTRNETENQETGTGLMLQDGINKKDIVFNEVIFVGDSLPGLPQPTEESEEISRASGWREWFSDYLTGKTPVGATVNQVGTFVYQFTSTGREESVSFRIAEDTGVRTDTVYTAHKDPILRYQAAFRKELP